MCVSTGQVFAHFFQRAQNSCTPKSIGRSNARGMWVSTMAMWKFPPATGEIRSIQTFSYIARFSSGSSETYFSAILGATASSEPSAFWITTPLSVSIL